jgi:hypothetical protein
MVYKLYPVIFFCSCFGCLLGGIAVIASFTTARWPLLLVPIPAAIAGYIVTSAIASRYPRIRYVNESEIDGLGYVHQPSGPVLLCCLIGFAIAVIQLVR